MAMLKSGTKGEGESMGQKLQQLREAAGMSQSQLARAAGVPVGTLRNWEQDRRVPLLDTAARVAAALRVSLDDLSQPVELPTVPAEPRRGPGRPRKETSGQLFDDEPETTKEAKPKTRRKRKE